MKCPFRSNLSAKESEECLAENCALFSSDFIGQSGCSFKMMAETLSTVVALGVTSEKRPVS